MSNTEVSPLQTIASRLLATTSFVEVAIAACELACELFAIQETAVSLHAPDGQPLLLVDDSTNRSDGERLSWVVARWVDDLALQDVRKDHAPHGDEYVLVCPLLQTGGLLGAIRFASARPQPHELRRDLATLGIRVSLRLAQLGVTTSGSPTSCLTTRQRQIAQLASRGLTNFEISQQLGLSENTIKAHLKETFIRLDLTSRTELASLLAGCGPIDDVPSGISRSRHVTITAMRA